MSKGSWTDDPCGSSDEDFTTLYPISDDRGAAATPRDFRHQSDAQDNAQPHAPTWHPGISVCFVRAQRVSVG